MCKKVQKGTTPWKKFWKFPIKSVVLLPYDIAIPYLGIYTREIKTYAQKDLYKNVHKSQNILNNQKLETAQVIINRKMGSEAYSYNRL